MLKDEIFILSASSGFIFIMLTIVLTYLVIRKAIEIKQRQKIDQFKDQYSSTLFAYISDREISRTLLADTPLKKKAIEELLTRFAELLEGEREQENLRALAEHHLKDYYLQSLKSRGWSKRMNALYHIEDFHIKSLETDVFANLNRPKISQEEKVLSLRILATFQYKFLYETLIGYEMELSEFEYRNILIRVEEQLFDQFVLGFHKCQNPLKYAILEVMAVKRELRYLPFIESVFANYSGEVRLRALKAITAIGYVKDIGQYAFLAKSDKWQERMMAAKLFGSLRESAFISELITLLHDSSWYVRSQAGQSLMMYSNGKELLQNVLQTSKDSFARDMAWEWINKGDF